jgi:hypothetical protein
VAVKDGWTARELSDGTLQLSKGNRLIKSNPNGIRQDIDSPGMKAYRKHTGITRSEHLLALKARKLAGGVTER